MGTNAGFVTTAPTIDPQANSTQSFANTGRAAVTHDTSPSDAIKIIEIGWWEESASSDEANFEVGLYADSAGVAGTLLEVSRTNAKGTTGDKWHIVTGLDWNINSSTEYWIGLQVDDGGIHALAGAKITGGTGWDVRSFQSTLPNPFDGGAIFDNNGMIAIYALVETSVAGVTRKIKISGTFQDKPIKTKVAGTFVDKPIKIKVGGTFQDA